VNHKFFFRGKKFEDTTSKEYGTASDNERFKSTKSFIQSKKDQKSSEDHSKNALLS